MSDIIKGQLLGLSGIAIPPERMRQLRPELVAQLAESIREQGQIQPILVRPRSEKGIGYILIAGRHRLEAVRKLGLDMIRAEIRTGLDTDQALLLEIEENLVRGELSPIEEAQHLNEQKRLYEKLHPEAKHGGAPGKAGGGKKAKDAKLASFVDAAAKQTGRSRRTLARSITRANQIPKQVLDKAVGTSLDKGDEVDALAKLPAEQQIALAERAAAGEKVSAKTEAKKYRRDEREQLLGAKQLALPEGTFGVIVEDFEWDYEVYSRETGMDRHAANHYLVAEDAHTAEEIVERTRDRFACAADDCVLFMWTTVPYLAIALEVMRLRGFKYVSNYVWDKEKPGTGHWNRNRHEHLLIGVKGNIPCPAPGTQWDSVIRALASDHSAKPEAFLEMIEQYYPTLRKIELNRRGPERPGWHAYGNEVEPAVEQPQPLRRPVAETPVAEPEPAPSTAKPVTPPWAKTGKLAERAALLLQAVEAAGWKGLHDYDDINPMHLSSAAGNRVIDALVMLITGTPDNPDPPVIRVDKRVYLRRFAPLRRPAAETPPESPQEAP